jgi:hypothetical protein
MQSADADRFDVNGQPCAAADWSAVRRIVTEGAAVAGVGILFNDSATTNTYLAKTSSQGAGHIGGVGILEEDGGSATFSAVRNSQGFGFIGGLGLVLTRNMSQDTFGWYAPDGGVVSDTGACDSTPRHLQGSGQLGGLGALLAVDDTNASYESNAMLGQGAGDLAPSVIGGPGVGILVSVAVSGGQFPRSAYAGPVGRSAGRAAIGPRSDLSAFDFFVDEGLCATCGP